VKRVAVVAGTRPEVIKMAPVYSALSRSERIEPVFLSMAQHREMLDQALEAFGITPDFDFNLMQPGQTLSGLTSQVIEACSRFLESEPIDAVLVQGDTCTMFGVALAAFYARVPVGHVEAGLRTYDFNEPWPEELNRRLAGPLARWCFAPTTLSLKNLKAEKIPEYRCFLTGNTVVDALLLMREKIAVEDGDDANVGQRCGLPEDFNARYFPQGDGDREKRFVLVTGHRRESFDRGLAEVCQALKLLAERYPKLGIVYPVHPNPNVREVVEHRLDGLSNVALIPPVGYKDFIRLMDRAWILITDSGGVQEEAPSLGKPVLVTRRLTERPEGIESGTCLLVGCDRERIVKEVERLMGDGGEYERRSRLANPYGDGKASERIRAILEKELYGDMA